MSAYSNSMVTELTQAGAFDYATASAFAEKHNISVRSVISKIRSLNLPYEKKVVQTVKISRVRKSEVVEMIAAKLSLECDKLAGLGKADLGSLQQLLKAI